MPLESLSSFRSTGTITGTNTVNNTQKINTVPIGTGDITISKFSEGISIVCNDGTTYQIRNGGTDGNELVIINGKQSDDNNSILIANANSVKIGSTENKPVELGYTVEDTSNSNEVATTNWVNNWVNTYAAVPAGTVITYAGTKTPGGYLFCDGSAVSRTTYSKLFEAIGTTYGNGDGSTTFNLPKINDNRFIEYVSTSDTIGEQKEAGLPNIVGKFYGPRVNTASGSATGAFGVEQTGYEYSASDDSGSLYHNFTFDASKCSDVYKDDVTTVQPKSITLRAYIKY